MSQEPDVRCPQCGTKASVIIWFTDEPGTGFGSANCPCCGGIDYTVRYNKVIRAVLADPADCTEDAEDLLSKEEYDRELTEYLLEQGLV